MISTKGRYALRVMIDLAQQEEKGSAYIPLKDIAERQGISKKYLEILMRELVDGGFVKGMSGKGGGYMLCRTPEAYTVGEILEHMEGTLAPVACLAKGAPPCGRAGECRTLPLWKEFNDMVYTFFNGKTLRDLL